MRKFDGFSELLKSGKRRIRDAEELLARPPDAGNERGAVYLAGYGVECLLKTYIIRSVTHTLRLSQAQSALHQQGKLSAERDMLSTDGHNFDLLLELSGLEERMDNALLTDYRRCRTWTSTMRYDPQPISRDEALRFVQAVQRLTNWIEGQI